MYVKTPSSFFQDKVSLKAIFIDQLLKSDAKHAMYVGSAKEFPLH